MRKSRDRGRHRRVAPANAGIIAAILALVAGCSEASESQGAGPEDSGSPEAGTSEGGASDASVPATFEGDAGEFQDERDLMTYGWVRIVDQIWMTRNLEYMPEGGVDGVVDRTINWGSTEPYPVGYYYTWDALMSSWQGGAAAHANRGLCPDGWHVPAPEEWERLAEHVNELFGPFVYEAGLWEDMAPFLKATRGWGGDGSGTDDLGFTAFAAGHLDPEDGLINLTWACYFWASAETSADQAVNVSMGALHQDFRSRTNTSKDQAISVRCLKDD